MARTFLLFDFGPDEEAAQKARHRLDAWKQAFRLGNKILFKFERADSAAGSSDGTESKDSTNKPEVAKEKSKGEREKTDRVRLLIRLDFSNHEKHLSQTWLQRIPGEEPFKSSKPREIRNDADDFAQVSEHFDSLK